MLGPIILNGIGFFTIPVFTRMLGPENYGLYTVYNSYQSMLLIVMSLQTQAIIGTASIYYKDKSRDRCFSNALTISLLCSALISFIVIVFIEPISKLVGISTAMISVMLIQTVGMLCVNWTTGKLAYDKKAKANFVLSTGLSLAAIGLSLLLIVSAEKGAAKYEAYVLGHAVPYAIVGIVCGLFILLRGRSFFAAKEWKFCLVFCLPLVFHAFANTLLHQADKIMVGRMISDSAAGVYGFAVTFANILNIIYNALNTTWVPFYHDDIKCGDKEKLFRKTNNYLFLFTSLTMGFIMAMPEVVKVFASSDYWESIEFIPILAVGIYFIFLYTFPVNFEFYYKKTKNIAAGTMLAGLLNVVLNLFLVKWIGMTGAAIATFLSYVLLFVFHVIIAEYVMKEEYHYKGFRSFYICIPVVLGGTALFYVIKDMPVLRWILFAGIAAVLVGRTIKNRTLF